MADEPFAGFYRPRFTQVPNDLFDELLPTLKLGELRVLLYLMRRTFGFDRDSAAVSLQQMEHGLVIKGERKDGGVGLSHNTLLASIRSLEQAGYIVVQRSQSQERGNETSIYGLRLRDESKTGTPPGSKTEPGGRAKNEPGLGPVSGVPSNREKERGEIPEAMTLWKTAQDTLRGEMNAANFETYLEGTVGLRLEQGTLVVHASRIQREALVGRFAPLLQRALGEQAVRFEG